MQKTLFNNNLLKQSLAIGSYLDQLLQEATHDPVEQESENKPFPGVREQSLIASELLVAEIAIPQPVAIVDSDAQVQQTEAPEPESIILEPELFPLQCLMFRVAGNMLSVPLIHVKRVLPWSDHLTILPQSPSWMLGLLKYQDQNVRVVDSNQVLHIKPAPNSAPDHVLILGKDEWAITSDTLENVITLEYSDIQWNQRRDDAMIFGTLRDSLASLINPDGIVKYLNSFKLKQATPVTT